MYASCAKATAAHINARPAAMRTMVWRRPKTLTRSVPAAVVGLLLYLMLRRWRKRTGVSRADYIRGSAGFLPVLEHLVGAQVAERLALFAQRGLRRREPRTKSLTGHTQGVLGVDLEVARERDDAEQQVAHLLEGAVTVGHFCILERPPPHLYPRRVRDAGFPPQAPPR